MIGFTYAGAQSNFQGQIVLKTYNVDKQSGKKSEDGSVNLYFTPDRIMVQDMDDYRRMGPIQSNGVLIRMKEKDFVFLTGEKQALRISKDDIVSMYSMMQNMSSMMSQQSNGSKDPSSNFSVEKTGDRKSIGGYDCEKVVLRDSNEPDETTSIWLTRDLNINWGMLTENWGADATALFPEGLPLTDLLDDGAFPMLMQHYKNGVLTEEVKAEKVAPGNVARAMVQLPPDTQVLSFQEYLMSKMQGN